MPPSVPEADRSIVIGDQTVAYRLRRSQRRTIGLTIDHRGLRVGAPTRAHLGDIESLIRQHGQWVLDKLAAWRNRTAPTAPTVTHGDTLPILGEAWRIELTAIGRRRWQFGPQTLYLNPATPEKIGETLEKALRDHARPLLAERLALHAARFGVPTPPLRLSSARTRWGSCNQRGDIALNWRLVHLPLAVIDYVVCHELAHLREMNHSPRFWSVVEQLCPDWRARRRELRDLARQIPRFQST